MYWSVKWDVRLLGSSSQILHRPCRAWPCEVRRQASQGHSPMALCSPAGPDRGFLSHSFPWRRWHLSMGAGRPWRKMSCERLRKDFSFLFLGADFPAVKERSFPVQGTYYGLFNREVTLDWSFENTATVNFCVSRKTMKILWIVVASEMSCILSSNIFKEKLMGCWSIFPSL